MTPQALHGGVEGERMPPDDGGVGLARAQRPNRAASVADVSSDAIQDDKIGLVHATRIAMSRAVMSVDGKDVNLSPGMATTAEIKTDQRRLIEYLLSPLLRYKHESLGER